jgi:hypothetical protein
MTPDEHYAEADRILGLTYPAGEEHLYVAEAQVHATLATVDADTMQMWSSLRAHLLERITQDRSLETFRRVWAEADARGEHGDRVRQALSAVVNEVLL